MALICPNPASTWRWELDDGEGGKAVFILGHVPSEVFRKWSGEQIEKDRVGFLLDMCRYGVKGHEGLQFSDGSAVPFNTKKDAKGRLVVADDTLEIYFQARVHAQLADGIATKGKGAASQSSETQGSTGGAA